MDLVCLGLNHKTASVETRERLAVSDGELPNLLADLCTLHGVNGTAVLSTCNRFELYASTASSHEAKQRIREFLHARAGGSLELYDHCGEHAARHLFRVSSGLDSMLLGETEIFGQVKKAYAAAQSAGHTDSLINRLFQSAFRAGKQVRTKTKIQHGSTSVGAVAVDLAEKIFGRLDHCEVMLIGAGEQSRVTAQSLLSRGAKSIFVSNRSFDRAEELAKEVKGSAIRFDDWEEQAAKVDIIISSTSAPHHLITVEGTRTAMRKRRGAPLFLIDVAVPRDVEPAVNELENVYLYDMDSLEQIASQARAHREKQIAECDVIIDAVLRERPLFSQQCDLPNDPTRGTLADAT